MKQRIITGVILVAIVVPTLLIGGIAFSTISTIALTIACHEIVHLFESRWPKFYTYSIYVLFALSAIAVNISIDYLPLVLCISIIYLLLLLVINSNVTFEDIGITYIVLVLLSLTVGCFVLFYSIDKYLVIYLLIGTYMTDTFCLFGGKLFGKHKLNERISPNKTIEGSIVGYLFGAVASFIFAKIVLASIPLIYIVLGSLIMPLVGQIGDLAFSSIKRHYSIKDFGNIFPGHGGILDRIDSLTFTSITLLALAVVIL